MNRKNEKPNDNQPFERLVDKVKQEVYSLEKKNGKKPTFDEYIEILIDEGGISPIRLREDMRAIALAWNGAKFGSANWRKIYSDLQKETSNADKNLTKEKTQMKNNKFINFIEGLGLEIDNEIIKGIRSIGIIKILLGVGGFLLLRFLVSYFGSEDSVFTFYFYSAIGLVLFLSWYMSELKQGAKLLSILRYGGAILALVISLLIVVGLVYGIIQYLIQAFEYLYQLLF